MSNAPAMDELWQQAAGHSSSLLPQHAGIMHRRLVTPTYLRTEHHFEQHKKKNRPSVCCLKRVNRRAFWAVDCFGTSAHTF